MTSRAAAMLIAALSLSDYCLAQESEGLPTFEQMEAEGAIIGEVRIDNQDIFDLSDPRENNALYRLANKLHIRTRENVIRRTLLFESGDPVSVQRIEESERLLLNNSYIYEVRITPLAYRDGVVDIEVVTRDTWTLDPGLGFSRRGGANETKYGLKELNLLGTGAAIEWQRTDADEGTIDEFQFNNNQLFGTRARFNYTYETRYDGDGQRLSLQRPFYALDSRWSAGVSGSVSDQLISTNTSTGLATQYRRDRNTASVFGGWSKGLIDGWTRRYSVGVDYLQDDYHLVPGEPAPTGLPIDETRVSPFLRFEVIEDRFEKTTNRNQVGRPEYFLLGFSSDVKLGYAATALGSTRPAWSYSAFVNKGWDLSRDRILVATGSISGLYADGKDEDQFFASSLQYFVPQSNRAQTFVGLAVDLARDPIESNQLALGGDNGLPGYPTSYQTGDHRVLLNLEQRFYTDWYPFRLFRIGGAVFFDSGRAWGGEPAVTRSDKWLTDIGFGLRIFSVRSAFGTVWKLDVAFPIDRPGDIPDYQVLFYRTTGF